MNISNNFSLIYATKRQNPLTQNALDLKKETRSNQVTFSGANLYYKSFFIKNSTISTLYEELEKIKSNQETSNDIKNFIQEQFSGKKSLFTVKGRKTMSNILTYEINNEKNNQEIREFLVDVYAHTFQRKEDQAFVIKIVDKNLVKNKQLAVKAIEALGEYFSTTKTIVNRRTYHINNSDLEAKIKEYSQNKDKQIQEAAKRALNSFDSNNTIKNIQLAEESQQATSQKHEKIDKRNLQILFNTYRAKSK